MMNKTVLRKLNRVPEGKPAWLNYQEYRNLQKLFDALPPPEPGGRVQDEMYAPLYEFLMETAGIQIPDSQEAVHLNAFVLIRRGFRSEEISGSEYEKLRDLLEGTEETDRDDMELHDFGNHRTLYQYLTEGLGIYVEPGRGPVWHRAKQLVNQFERTSQTK